ncbi:MAG: IS630 family transposase [Campylobacterota bacterium]|nr:IS630 family transposase [Campylobacterota bacterium]
MPAKKPDDDLYEVKLNKLINYEKLESQNKIDIYYFDESGFSHTSNIPKLWTPIRTTAIIKTFVAKRINVLGFLSKNGTLKSYIADGRVDSDKVIEVFDDFANNLSKPTVVVLDNASYHKSKKFKANLFRWMNQGLTLLYLPPYSPQLNIIEILWRFMKYIWIDYKAYLSFENLKEYIETIFKKYGNEFVINFKRWKEEIMDIKLLPYLAQ